MGDGDRKQSKGPKESEEKDDVMPTGMPDDSAEKDEEIKDLKRALVAFLKRGDKKVGKNEGGDKRKGKEGEGKGDKEGDRKEPKGPKDPEEKDDVMPTGMPDDSAEKEEMKDVKRALVAFLKRRQ